MSKSMAIEGVMKIFLMVAVIIVGMSFLMKAFGIDLLGWLKEKFQVAPSDGKFLHVRFDSGARKVYQFHLVAGDSPKAYPDIFGIDPEGGGIVHRSIVETAGREFFNIKIPEKDAQLREDCVILTTRVTGQNDRMYVYYIKPGVVIDKETNSISSAIKPDMVEFEGCVATYPENDIEGTCGKDDGCRSYQACVRGQDKPACSDINEANRDCGWLVTHLDCKAWGEPKVIYDAFGQPLPVQFKAPKYCDDKYDLINVKFDTAPTTGWYGDCGKSIGGESPLSTCNLLLHKDYGKKDPYIVQYGIICTDKGIWHVCSDKTLGEKIFEKTCTQDGEFFYWG